MELLWQEVAARLLDWRAPFEILLITLGLYLLYRNLSAMGAWKIVVGILIGLGVFALARLFHLRGIEWVLSHFSGVALIGLIVLFQPEIRRLFERAASFRGGRSQSQRPDLAPLLAEVLFDLARRKWGAIVVIPGRESLASRTSSGVRLDAQPSYPVLVSLFDPTSPGHDGAVVIEDGKLTRFGVRLPLSRRGRLPEDHGTRHHAALGLTEATDALVLVVSEERGIVSAFRAGEFQEVNAAELIAAMVEDQWERAAGRTAPTRTPWARRLASTPLLGSCVVATLFWLSIVPHGGDELEISFQVPVEYTAASDVGVAGERVEQARVLVAGAAADLSRVNASLLRVRVDLAAAEPGVQLVPLALGGIELPPGVRVIDIEPQSLELNLVPLVERELPVRPQLVGAPPRGLRLEAATARPRTLRVLVPQAGLETPEEILTAPIRLSAVRGPMQVMAKVMVPSGVRPVDRSWPDVEVTLDVRPREDR
jgi:uncharacterized protein (TIGR00159 family)